MLSAHCTVSTVSCVPQCWGSLGMPVSALLALSKGLSSAAQRW